MNTQTLSKNRWFWAWQDDKEETWLREMSLSGWHLVTAAPFGRYTFLSGEARDYVYRLDFQTTAQKDHSTYVKIFEDAGWEFVGAMSGWQYFRKLNQPGETMEIFTDTESKIQKYQRLLVGFVIFLPIYFVLQTPLRSMPDNFFTFILTIFWMMIILVYIVVVLKIINRINQLKKQGKRLIP